MLAFEHQELRCGCIAQCTKDNNLWWKNRADLEAWTLSPLQQSKIQLIWALARVTSEAPSFEQHLCLIMAYYIADVPEVS